MARITLRLVPNFDVSPENLDTETYQVRRTARTKEDYLKLLNLIKEQGQVEPIQVFRKDDRNYLIAGAGRVWCLRKLGMKASALVYEGLDKDGILKIAVGTNEGRKAMSAWDRMVSIGEYVTSENLVVFDMEQMKRAVKVFGRNLPNIIRDYELWEFFNAHQEFVKYFENNDVSFGVMNCIDEILNPYKEDIENWQEIVDMVARNNRGDITIKQFASQFVKDFTTIAVNFKHRALEANKGDGLSIEELHSVEKSINRMVKRHIITDNKIAPDADEITKKCLRIMQTLYNQCNTVIETMEKLLELPYRTKLPSAYLLKLSRLITKLNQTGVKLL